MDQRQPVWNSKDVSGSFKAHADWLREQVCATFLRDGMHAELYFLLLPDGQVALGAPPPDQPRDKVVSRIREAVRMHEICGVIHVAEAWTYLPKGENDHTYRQIIEGEIPVSELKPEDRTEALMYRTESRDGATCLWVHPILRGDDGVRLSAPLVIEGRPKGRLDSFFSDPLHL